MYTRYTHISSVLSTCTYLYLLVLPTNTMQHIMCLSPQFFCFRQQFFSFLHYCCILAFLQQRRLRINCFTGPLQQMAHVIGRGGHDGCPGHDCNSAVDGAHVYGSIVQDMQCFVPSASNGQRTSQTIRCIMQSTGQPMANVNRVVQVFRRRMNQI